MKYAPRVQETTLANSTVTISLLGASQVYLRTFLAAFAVGTTGIAVVVADALGNFEEGKYTLTSAALLTRESISGGTNGTSPVAFPAGTKTVTCALLAAEIAKFLATDAATVAAVADPATSKLSMIEGGVAKQIAIADLLTAVGETIPQLGVASAVAGADLLPISQGGVEKRITMTLIAAAVATLLGLTDTTAPSVSSAAVANSTPTIVSLQMSETMNASFIPVAGAFTVSGHTVSSVNISGSIITLTLSAAFVYGETPRTASYTQPGTNNARDGAGNLLANFSGMAITNNVAGTDLTAPTFASAAISNGTPSVIDVTMSEPLGATTPATSAWAASGKTISGISISGSVVSITVSVPYAFGDTPTITYTQPGTNRLQDVAGNLAASFGPSSVTNNISVGDTTPPAFASALVANGAPTQIVVTMSETLAAFTPAAAAFTLSGGKTCTAVSRSGATLTLTASAAYAYGDSITFSYVKPGTNQLRDAANNETTSFGPSAVTNNIALPVPAAVTALAAGTKTDVTIALTWTNAATATGWVVKQRLNSVGGAYTTSTMSVAAGATGGTVSGLSASTAYDFEVTDSNATGNGPPATLANISTNAALTNYTITPYTGGSAPNISVAQGSFTTDYGSIRRYAVSLLAASRYWNIAPTPASSLAGWGVSSTVEPATITSAQNLNGSSSINGMLPMDQPSSPWGNNSTLLAAPGASGPYFLWVKPINGAAQCMNPTAGLYIV